MDADELRIPHVSDELIEYIEYHFNTDAILILKSNNDEKIGYLAGVRSIINHLKLIQKEA